MDADLAAALETGRHDQVEDAFRTGQLDPDTAEALLWKSVYRNWTEAVALLLRHGVNPTSVEIYQLFHCRSLEIFKLLGQYQWPFKQEGHLLIPRMFEHRDILDWLVDQGVELNWHQDLIRGGLKKGEYDKTVAVLNEAAAAGKPEIFDYLVSRGADPSRSLPLHYVPFYQPEDSTKVAAVIDHFVEKYQYDPNGDGKCGGLIKLTDFTDVDGLAGPPLRPAVYHHNIPAVRALLRHGADPNPNLVTAIDRRDMEALKILLEAGGDATDACVTATIKSYFDAVKISLEHGADPKPALKEDADLTAKHKQHQPMGDDVKKLLLEHM